MKYIPAKPLNDRNLNSISTRPQPLFSSPSYCIGFIIIEQLRIVVTGGHRYIWTLQLQHPPMVMISTTRQFLTAVCILTFTAILCAMDRSDTSDTNDTIGERQGVGTGSIALNSTFLTHRDDMLALSSRGNDGTGADATEIVETHLSLDTDWSARTAGGRQL